MSSTTTPQPKVWLITGCSSGFGFSLALHILASGPGHKVIATSRTPSKTPSQVSQIQSLGGTWLALDICSPESELATFIEKATAIYGTIDVLKPVPNSKPTSSPPLTLMRLLIPTMRARRSGTIINMSSTAGIEARPSRSLYSASKFALEAVSEALYAELKPFNIRVLIVEPGAFRTRFADNFVSPAREMPDDYRGSEMESVLGGVRGMRDGGMEGWEGRLGDVGKGVKAIFDVVEGTGWAVGMQEFLRLPLGRDGSARWEVKLRNLRENLDGTERVWSRTGED
ncbi:putative short chain oxidoreductase/dehydrogenase [Leptodontidium sp. MPI-SDFR-AT-0119]|nr:putative short chain oxidoreductase/dehydrogenase [Leptodontidium sp. MPI-SDFR-AT-0119]